MNTLRRWLSATTVTAGVTLATSLILAMLVAGARQTEAAPAAPVEICVQAWRVGDMGQLVWPDKLITDHITGGNDRWKPKGIEWKLPAKDPIVDIDDPKPIADIDPDNLPPELPEEGDIEPPDSFPPEPLPGLPDNGDESENGNGEFTRLLVDIRAHAKYNPKCLPVVFIKHFIAAARPGGGGKPGARYSTVAYAVTVKIANGKLKDHRVGRDIVMTQLAKDSTISVLGHEMGHAVCEDPRVDAPLAARNEPAWGDAGGHPKHTEAEAAQDANNKFKFLMWGVENEQNGEQLISAREEELAKLCATALRNKLNGCPVNPPASPSPSAPPSPSDVSFGDEVFDCAVGGIAGLLDGAADERLSAAGDSGGAPLARIAAAVAAGVAALAAGGWYARRRWVR
jgi:hypothetical protein